MCSRAHIQETQINQNRTEMQSLNFLLRLFPADFASQLDGLPMIFIFFYISEALLHGGPLADGVVAFNPQVRAWDLARRIDGKMNEAFMKQYINDHKCI